MKFSLLISVYKVNNSIFFDQALQSIVTSSVLPDEVVLVCDGKLTDKLEQVIDNYIDKLPIVLVKLENNVGLGLALQAGLKQCSHEWVARFDADDICCHSRFEMQINFLQKKIDIDILGGQIIEFDESPDEATAVKKRVPLDHQIIQQYAKSRNPMNHMTVMFRKSAVLAAGNYQHSPLYEDYDLWIRMLMENYRFANIDKLLVYARTGESMYERRGGLSYAKQEIIMQIKFHRLGFITFSQLIKNLGYRVPVRVIPNKLRKIVYLNFLRQ